MHALLSPFFSISYPNTDIRAENGRSDALTKVSTYREKLESLNAQWTTHISYKEITILVYTYG